MGNFEDLMFGSKFAGSVAYTIILVIATELAKRLIDRLATEDYPTVIVTIISNGSLEPFDTVLSNLGIDPQDPVVASFHREVNPDTESFAYPIVSDYKIPNQFGSYPTIYGPIYPIDRSFMRDVEDRWRTL
jgi:hypothetical protein